MKTALHSEHGETLLKLARDSLHEALGEPAVNAPVRNWLMEHGACFVTLSQQDRLRGCIGTLEAHRSLVEDVRANTKAAALLDSRFVPLAAHELPYTRIEISVLSRMEPLRFEDEDDLFMQLRPHVDGVVLRYGTLRSTFLPLVWQQLSDPERFLSELKQKAGLPADFWSDDIKVYRYTVQKWREQDSLNAPAYTWP